MNEPIDILINANVRITGIARSQADAFNAHGVRIESEKHGVVEGWRPYRVVKEAADAADRPYKFIIACFKCLPDLLPSASVLAPFLDSPFAQEAGGPTVVLIQNGLGIEHPVQIAYPNVPIISAVAWIGANLLKGPTGPTVTHGMLEELVIGLYQEAIALKNTTLFADLLNKAGQCKVVDDIQPKRYEKSLSAMVAPDVLPYTLPAARRLGLEVLYIAREWGYSEDVLPLKTVDMAIKVTIHNYQTKGEPAQTPATPATPMARGDVFGGMGYGFPPSGGGGGTRATKEFKPSMLLDVEAGRPSELEPIIGSLLDRARAKGVETPRLDLVYATLKVNQDLAVKKFAESSEHQEHIKNWFLRRPNVAGAQIDGRKEWEKASSRAEVERSENVAVRMAGGKQKVTGKPIPIDDDEDTE
ncbi:hypothetical protein RQP46_010585 [Phenoliferia psychrophenolica]